VWHSIDLSLLTGPHPKRLIVPHNDPRTTDSSQEFVGSRKTHADSVAQRARLATRPLRTPSTDTVTNSHEHWTRRPDSELAEAHERSKPQGNPGDCHPSRLQRATDRAEPTQTHHS
jgi:hypothetical protein